MSALSQSPYSKLFSKFICINFIILGFICACTPLQIPHPVNRITTRIAKTNIIGIRRNPAQYCAPNAPDTFPGPKKIAVTNIAFLDDLCILGFKNRVIASTQALPSYLRRIYPHILSSIPVNADIVLSSPSDTQIISPSIPTQVITGTYWKERLYNLAKYLTVEKTATIALEDYSHYATQTSIKWDTQNTEINFLTIRPKSMSLLGRNGFISQVLADANVGRPDRINFDDPQYISLKTLSLAEADIIYISYPPTAISAVKYVLNSPEWSHLGAASQSRQFIVNYSWWNQGQGLMAARSILDDLRNSLNFTS